MSEVRRLWIEGPVGRLEAALRAACPARAAAVLAHPHPLYGGTLHNPVVFHADRALHRAGLTTLRFDFRGVGSSEGVHDEGRGEKDDVGSAVSWLRGIVPGIPLVVVGYSFGAWCGLRYAAGDDTVAAVVAIGLPVRVYPFDEVERLGRPLGVVQGEHDEFGSPEEVRRVLDRARPPGRLWVVPGATHLFPGRAPEVAQRVVEAVEQCLGAASPRRAGSGGPASVR